MLDVAIPVWVYPILVWTVIWKAVAAWKAARNNHLVWFVVFFVVNTFGVLPIVYLFIFQRIDFSKRKIKRRVRKKVPSLV